MGPSRPQRASDVPFTDWMNVHHLGNRNLAVISFSLFKFASPPLVPTVPHFYFSLLEKLRRVDRRRSPATAEMASVNRWLRPEVYPLFAAVGVAVGICGLQLVRNICINPEVRVTKENRAAGVLENFAEGEKYAQHFVRRYVRNKAPEIMPSINSFFTEPNRN